MDSDERLMEQVQQGDTAAYEALLRRHRPRLQAFFRRLGCESAPAEDATQEALLRVWLARDGYRAGARFLPWLFSIARNCHRDAHRRATALRRTVPLHEQLGAAGREALAHLQQRREQPETILLRRQEAARVRRAVVELPEGQRLVFLLAHFEGLTQGEIAEVLQIPVGTVKSRLHHAVRGLRDKLSGELGESPGDTTSEEKSDEM
jgi:RNA polymerase sigma-70 factor (ECF subfamily)